MRHFLLGLTAGLSALALMPDTADAAFIRRGKIKLKQTIGYKVVITTSGEDTDSVAAVALDEETALDLTVSRLDFSADVDPDDFAASDDGTLAVPFALDLGAEGFFDITAAEADFSLTPCTATPCAWSTVTLSDDVRVKARMVGSEGDALLELESVVILSFGKEAQQEIREGVDLLADAVAKTTGGDGAVDLTLDQVRSKWKVSIDEDPGEDTVTLDVTAYDAAGESVDRYTDTVTLGEDGVSDGIGQVKLRERRDGSYRITAITSDTTGAEETLSTTVSRADGEVVFSAEDAAPAGTERHFLMDEVLFLDHAFVPGSTYSVVIDARGSDRALLGAVDAELTVGEDGSVQALIDDVDPTDGLEIGLLELSYDADLDAFTWLVAVAGESASQVTEVDLIIDSLDGSEPVADVLTLPLYTEWRQWSQTFTTDAPISEEGPVSVSVALTDAEGGAIDTVGAEGGTGTAYRSFGFGKGTKNTTSQAATKPQLL